MDIKEIASGLSSLDSLASQSYGFNIMQHLQESLALNMLMKCTQYCAIVVSNTLQAFSNVFSFFFWFSGSDILLEFFNTEVAVMVQFGESLPYSEGCKAGGRAMKPALLHNLHDSCQDPSLSVRWTYHR